ncbi:MAG: HAD-IIIA family hydrolase [Eubacterium sp.]|nr:HAD-IIIA family hydrolase [Eubacterium sp.]
MKYKAVVFDLDGTLLNTLEDLKDAVNAALRSHQMPERSLEEIRNFVGNGIAKLIERSVPENTGKEEQEEILAAFRQHYGVHCQDKTLPYKGILELLSTLGEKGYRIAVVSNKAHFAVKELIPHYFHNLIPVAMGENEAAGIAKKPAPAMVWKALEELGCSREEAVYVGDSDVDYETAKNSGLDFIGVSWGFRGRAFLEKLGAENIVDAPGEIYEKLEK